MENEIEMVSMGTTIKKRKDRLVRSVERVHGPLFASSVNDTLV